MYNYTDVLVLNMHEEAMLYTTYWSCHHHCSSGREDWITSFKKWLTFQWWPEYLPRSRWGGARWQSRAIQATIRNKALYTAMKKLFNLWEIIIVTDNLLRHGWQDDTLEIIIWYDTDWLKMWTKLNAHIFTLYAITSHTAHTFTHSTGTPSHMHTHTLTCTPSHTHTLTYTMHTCT